MMESQESAPAHEPNQVKRVGNFPYGGRRWFPRRQQQPAAPTQRAEEKEDEVRRADPSQYYELIQKRFLSEEFEQQWGSVLEILDQV